MELWLQGMQLDKAIASIATFVPEQFHDLRRHVDPAWVLQALEDTGTVTLRKRKLPAEQMVWLAIGMALLRNRRIDEVVRQLDLNISPTQPSISPAAVAQARVRLGAEPMQWLFAESGKCWARRYAKDDTFCGLKVYGVDGTSLRVADSDSNGAHFGYADSGNRGPSAYPMLRLVVLMSLRSHLLAAAAFGPYGKSELHYAEQLWPQLEDDSVTILDRGFLSAALLLGICASGTHRHWLTRAKSSTRYRVIETLGTDDMLVEMDVSQVARTKDPSLPKTWQMRAIRYQRKGFAPQLLLTSMLDVRRYSAEHIRALYHERWELELGYDELKTVMLDRQETIRSKSPELVEQEMWGLLTAYNLVRLEMVQVGKLAKLNPLRVSFVMTLRYVCDEWSWSSISTAPGAIPKHIERMHANIARFILPERRPERTYPRAVKIKMTGYAKKQRTAK
jgi:Insertion element 4 transposase N-terminal/Transposase DDE domain